MSLSQHIMPRKRFGQHFLEDDSVLMNMHTAIHPNPEDHMVEIGPGRAALTQYLVSEVGDFEAVEIDRDLILPLRHLFAEHSHFKLHQVDALSFDFRSLVKDEKKLRIVGNLPYNISTPLLFHLFDQLDVIQDMHFLLQKEVVDRLCAERNDSNYGRLSVMAQYFCSNLNLFEVGPEAFNPPPKVDSAFIRMVPHATPPYPAKNWDTLSLIVRTAFNLRRKTLGNSLKQLVPAAELEKIGIDPQRRPQELSVEEFVKISNHKTL